MEMRECPHCGMVHRETCHRIRAIEYYPNGTVKRIELHGPQEQPQPTQSRYNHTRDWYTEALTLAAIRNMPIGAT